MNRLRRIAYESLRSLLFRLYRGSTVAEYGGVKIVDSRTDAATPWFRSVAVKALEIIATCDPRRFIRVQHHIEWIATMPLGHDGVSYDKGTKTCCVDRSSFVRDFSQADGRLEVEAIRFASGVVHEATHGKIRRLTRGTKTVESFLREERICQNEERKFLEAVGRHFPAAQGLTVSMSDADEAWYRDYYSARGAKRFARSLGINFRRRQ